MKKVKISAKKAKFNKRGCIWNYKSVSGLRNCKLSCGIAIFKIPFPKAFRFLTECGCVGVVDMSVDKFGILDTPGRHNKHPVFPNTCTYDFF